jgi:FtsP/CotA-like multicopper oxidase with cupredoxin domain
MSNFLSSLRVIAAGLLLIAVLPANAQSFRAQCPFTTITHPNPNPSAAGEPAYTAPTFLAPSTWTTTPISTGGGGVSVTYTTGGYPAGTGPVNGTIKCQQISGGDGLSTMADGNQIFMYSFGPLSGLYDISRGLPGTQFYDVYNTTFQTFTANPSGVPVAGDPDTTDGGTAVPYSVGNGPNGLTAATAGSQPSFTYNGAIGLAPDTLCAAEPASCPNVAQTGPFALIDGHVDPRQIIDVGVMNGNIPAPLMAIDEDDEFFLSLTNVGMIMRPDLFEQHTVHFHGYPNASPFYDGVPDASIAINIGGTFTYYYLAPDAGTYFWHCHITPPEHLQMGMVGQIFVRPRQDRVPQGTSLYTALGWQQLDLRTACNSSTDILCSNPMPPANNGALQGTNASGSTQLYAYNDGDGSTAYDVEYPIQIHGFDPNFHFVGMTFNPEAFVDMKDKYFLLNGRSYPDTASAGPQQTQTTDGRVHFSQPLNSIINIPAGGRALLRISDLDVTEFQTLASLGIPMIEIGYNAKLLRDQAGNDLAFKTNSITLGGGESLDVVLDACQVRATNGTCTTPYPVHSVFYLYTPNLDHLSNDAENFGGLMTEVNICNAVDPVTKICS